MPSTYTDELRLELQANGENSSTWGTKVNTGFSLVEDAISGMASIATTGGSTTLTTVSGGADEARNAILKITGTLVSNATITVPAKSKQYLVWNATSGAYTVQVKTSGGTGVYVVQGSADFVFCDGTDVYSSGRAVSDSTFRVADETDPSKLLAFQLSGLTTATTRTLTVPDVSDTIVGLAATQTLTGKTINLTSNTLTTTKAQLNTAVSDGDVLFTDAIGSTVQAYDADLTTWAGVTPGTGVATALAVNVGSAGAFITNGGALGTPSGGTLTNCTGLPAAGVSGTALVSAAIGTTVQGYDADTAKTDVDQSWTGAQRGTITTDNDGSFDLDVANNFKCTTSGNVTLTFTNIASAGGQSGNILFINDSNRTITAHANTKVASGGLTTLSATGTYVIGYFCDGTNVYISATGALS